MSAIRNYTLVQTESPQELVEAVSKACGENYQPVGGVAVVREPAAFKGQPGRTLYNQAMIRLWQPGEQLVVNGAGIVRP